MKKFLGLCLVFAASFAQAQDEKHIRESVVKDVRIYQSGAQVNRMVKTSVESGTTVLYIENLSSAIDQQSISVGGTGDALLVAVSYQLDYLTGDRKPPEIRRLEDSLKVVTLDLEKVNGLEQVYNEEISLLNANKSVGGANVGVDTDALREVADFFRTRMIELKVKLIDVHAEQKSLREKQDKLNRQLAEMNAKKNRPYGTILVTLQAKQKTNVNLLVSYYTGGASWAPSYDIRAKSVNAPVSLNYKANVSQSTGEDWENVKLVLSTGNPSIGGTRPVMNPWFIDFYAPVYNIHGARGKAEQMEMAAPVQLDQVVVNEGAVATMEQYVQVTESATTTDFDIALPYTIRSDGKANMVDIQSHELPASYSYFAAPKLDKDAFLLARITGWDQLNLLPGNANIYFEGNYVGNSVIDPTVTQDTMDLSLGRDKRIVITRDKKKEFSQTKSSGSNMVKETVYEISIRNTKREAVELVLEDQIPVSRNNEIKVSPGDYSGGSYDEQSGKVTWRLQVAPGATEKRVIGFSVKYPKGKPITNF